MNDIIVDIEGLRSGVDWGFLPIIVGGGLGMVFQDSMVKE